MVLLRYLLMIIGIGLLVGAAGILVWDLFTIVKSRKSPAAGSATPWEENAPPQVRLRWQETRRLAAFSAAPLLIGGSIVPGGAARMRAEVNNNPGRAGSPDTGASAIWNRGSSQTIGL